WKRPIGMTARDRERVTACLIQRTNVLQTTVVFTGYGVRWGGEWSSSSSEESNAYPTPEATVAGRIDLSSYSAFHERYFQYLFYCRLLGSENVPRFNHDGCQGQESSSAHIELLNSCENGAYLQDCAEGWSTTATAAYTVSIDESANRLV